MIVSLAAKSLAKVPCAIPAQRPLQSLRALAPARCQSNTSRGRAQVVACSATGTGPDVKIHIEGMMCGGCSSRIENVLKGMESVKSVAVSLEGKVATVQLSKGDVTTAEAQAAAAALVDTINGLGFEAKIQS